MTVYGGVHDTRWTIVVKAANVAQANAAARVIEPDGDTFTAPLYDTGGTLVAYWCGWQMPAAVASSLGGELRRTLGLNPTQIKVIAATERGTWTPPGSWSLLIFDGTFDTGWTPGEILTLLALTGGDDASSTSP